MGVWTAQSNHVFPPLSCHTAWSQEQLLGVCGMATAPSPPRPKDLIANRVNLYIYHGKTSRAHSTQIRSREGPFSPHGGLRGGSGTQGNSLASRGEREWQQTRQSPFCCSTSLISLLTSMRVDGDEENPGKRSPPRAAGAAPGAAHTDPRSPSATARGLGANKDQRRDTNCQANALS